MVPFLAWESIQHPGVLSSTHEMVPVPHDFLVYPGSPRDSFEGDPTTTFRYDQDFAFIQAIVNGHGGIPTFYDGMRTQAVVDAVVQSALERRWIDIPDVPPLTTPLAAARGFL